MKGSIIKREGKGGAVSWLLKYDGARDAVTGKRSQLYKTVRGTKKAAQVELRRLLGEMDNGTHVDPSKLVLRDWVATWLKNLDVLEKVSVRTLEGYSDCLNVHVVPTLGSTELQKLTASHIDDLYAKLLTAGGRANAPKGLAPQTVLHVHRAFFSCLKAAVKKRLMTRNPAEDAEVPRAKRTRNAGEDSAGSIKALDQEQLGALRAAFRGSVLHTLVEVAAATGLRRGEILGLRWSTIDLAKRTLRVERVVERSRQLGVRLKADAKNESSRRTIGFGEALVDVLKLHRREQKELALKLGVTYPADGLVFPCVIKRPKGRQPEGGVLARDVDFGRPWDPEAITKDFRRVAKAAGFAELRLHDLRHTHATLLLMAGVPVHEVAQRLGHSTPVITMTTYSHVIQRSSDHAAQVWEGITAAQVSVAS
jgi:integrase